MTATVVHLKTNMQPDPHGELLAERERLSAELARLSVVDTRLAAAEGRLADIEKAIAALDRSDGENFERWAAGGGEGDAPEPLLAERRAMLGRRLDLQAEADAAQVAVDAVAAKRTCLIVEMNRVGARIRERQVAAALEQARAHHAEVEKLAGEIGQRMMRVEALRQVLTDSLSEAASRRDDAQAAVFRTALGDVDKLRAPQVLGDAPTVARFAAEWREALR